MTRAELAYGAPGLVLAMVAMPVYLLLPPFYAERTTLGLSMIGLILVLTRLGDALIDPWIGRLVDATVGTPVETRVETSVGATGKVTAWLPPRTHLGWMLLAVPVMLLGLAMLFMPPQQGLATTDHDALKPWQTGWLVLALILTYAGFAVASIAHQAWGAALGVDAEQRARLAASREGAALAGVVMASVAGGALGPVWLAPIAAVTALLTLGWAWRQAPRLAMAAIASAADTLNNPGLNGDSPDRKASSTSTHAAARPPSPWRQAAFRRLYTVFVLNGIASALPATLVLFFMRDVIGLDDSQSAGLLALYFVAAACALPLWLRLAARYGQRSAWLTSMAMSIAAFVGCLMLQAGDVGPYAAIVLMTGLALGADLVLPQALLAGVIAAAAQGGSANEATEGTTGQAKEDASKPPRQHAPLRAEGRYVGLWQVATKANLALAAGLALPALAWLGYDPQAATSAASSRGLAALTWAYAGLPCLFKLLAALVLARSPMPEHVVTTTSPAPS